MGSDVSKFTPFTEMVKLKITPSFLLPKLGLIPKTCLSALSPLLHVLLCDAAFPRHLRFCYILPRGGSGGQWEAGVSEKVRCAAPVRCFLIFQVLVTNIH